MDTQPNRRNSRYLSNKPVKEVDLKARFNPVNKTPRMLVLGMLSSHSKKCSIVFIDTNKKINMTLYQHILDNDVNPRMLETYAEGNFAFQQDGAAAYSADSIQQKLTEELGKGAISGARRYGPSPSVTRTELPRLQHLERIEG